MSKSSVLEPGTDVRPIKNDGKLTIATGRSRLETSWKNREMLWSELLERLSKTNRTGETHAEFLKMAKSQQDQIKDVGGFVGGTLRGGRRKGDAVAWRQVVTLDADYPKGDLWASVAALIDSAAAMYSTHKHSPSNPRLRLLLPLSRPVTPEEYQAIARRIAADLGIDFFDDTTYQPHRLMYWPSTPSDGEYVFKVQDGAWLNPDEVLARYQDWRDPSYWPESSRAQQARKKLADRQGDPREKRGWIGAFCRTYDIRQVIDEFLSDVYEPMGDDRYTYLPGSCAGGLVLYDDGLFAYSHHGTDPIGGRLVNSFDLVRLHKFAELDDEAEPGTRTERMPSFRAMQDLAMKDDAVKVTLGRDKLAEAEVEFKSDLAEDVNLDDWLKRLDSDRQGKLVSRPHNVKLILLNDPKLKGAFAHDDFADRTIVLKDLPWRKAADGKGWTDSDDSGLRNYLDAVYDIHGPGIVNDAFNEILLQCSCHPVREYLAGLEWDGVKRLDTLFIDYLGAEETKYTKAVTRKSLTAAVARVMEPGCKFDYVLVLVGPQGIGKSRIIDKLGGKWFSDSLSTVHGKEAYEQLRGMWILELGELQATRKAEVEAIKLFLSKRSDSFRPPYGRRIVTYPRQCVFIGTTNDQEFLRDKTGNRRFWPVMAGVDGRAESNVETFDQYQIDQIWAEAREAYEAGEALFLTGELEAEATARQELHTEESAKAGAIREFLDKLLPEGWEDLDIPARRRYIHGTEFGSPLDGTRARDRVCALEVWCELFEGDPKNITPILAREINDVIRTTPGWVSRGTTRFGSFYGRQRAFMRAL